MMCLALKKVSLMCVFIFIVFSLFFYNFTESVENKKHVVVEFLKYFLSI